MTDKKTGDMKQRHRDQRNMAQANKNQGNKDQRRLYIVGVGMGNPHNLTVEAGEAIGSAQLLIGASRMTGPYRDGKRCIDTYKTEEILRILTDELLKEDGAKITAVLVSGDSGFYSGTRKLLAALEEDPRLSGASAYNVTVLPGVSSLSYFCAKIGVSWENVKIVNLHGARENLWQAVLTHEKVFAITGGSGGVSEALTELVRMGFASLTAYVGERLSYEDERIRKGTVQELLKGADDCDGLTVLYLENPRAVGSPLTGLPDTAFVRGDAAHGNQTPMTKSEVRAVVMSRLRIRETDIVYDIGAGTGSVTVEMALAASKGTVYAVECDPKAVELCKLNKQKFGLHNIKIIEGTAPHILCELPAPDAAFIGGSRGQLRDIIACLVKKNPTVRLVVNTVTTENTNRALALLENEAFTGVEAVQLQVSRIKKTGAGHMVSAQNPVTIVSARGAGPVGVPGPALKTGRGVLIAGTGSGSGKTTLVCGLLRVLKDAGSNPCAFKCGPDYIDPSFHNKITGVPCYNLDPFFTDAETMQMLYERHCDGYDISVIEGVMGYYDGIGFTGEASTYSVAKALGVPVILTVDCKGMGHSVMAALEGYLHHREPSYIAGVIFNRLAPALYEQAAEAARSLGIQPLGYLPDLVDASLAGRHLGLVMADEVEDFEAVTGRVAEAVARTVDVDAVMRIADAGCRGDMACVGTECDNGNTPLCRIAVARDEAFCFLYEDNLHFLREHGALIVPFSPLHDKMLPECDALYLSGGYPELYAAGLEENASMREDIRTKIEDGMPCIAECGGFLYLHDRLEACAEKGTGERPENGKTFYKMTGVIKSDAVNGRRKGRFGYIEATLAQDCLLGRQGETFRAHEFHYWESQAEGCGLQIYKPGSGAAWQEGICTDTLYAGFPHLYFYGSPKTGENYIRAAAAYAAGRNVR